MKITIEKVTPEQDIWTDTAVYGSRDFAMTITAGEESTVAYIDNFIASVFDIVFKEKDKILQEAVVRIDTLNDTIKRLKKDELS